MQSDPLENLTATQALWDDVARTLSHVRERASHQNAMLFLLASPQYYVPRYSLSAWQRLSHPIMALRFEKYRRHVSIKGQSSLHLDKADDLLGRIEFGRHLSASERHFVRQQRLKHLLHSRQVLLALAGTGLRQSGGKLHIWKQPGWLFWVARIAQASCIFVAVFALFGTIWSVADSGKVVRETYILGFFAIYFVWMASMAASIGGEWRRAQQLRELMSVERLCSQGLSISDRVQRQDGR